MSKKTIAVGTALTIAALAFIAVLYALFGGTVTCVVNDGSYQLVAEALNLTPYKGDASAAGEIIELFEIGRYDASRLLMPGQSVVAYPALIARIFAFITGGLFSTRTLAVVYAFILSAGIYLLVRGLYEVSRIAAYTSGLGVVLVFLDNALVGYLNSLYPMGASIAFTILYIGFVVRSLCMERGSGTGFTVMSVITGGLVIRSSPYMAIFIPAVIIGTVMTVWHACPKGRVRLRHVCLSALAVLYAFQCVSMGYERDADWDSAPNNYAAVFSGYAGEASDAQKLLEQFGLDESYIADIGRGYYDGSGYAHDPLDENEWALLETRINLAQRIKWSLNNLDTIARIQETVRPQVDDYFSVRLTTEDGDIYHTSLSPWPVLGILLGSGVSAQNIWLLVAAIALLALAFLTERRSGARCICLLGLGTMLCALLYLPWCTILTGGLGADKYKVIYNLLCRLAVAFGFTAALCAAQKLYTWLATSDGRLYLPASDMPKETRVSWIYKAAPDDDVERRRLIYASAAVCTILLAIQLLPADHIGGVNNGDYGRMMEQLEISWTEEYEKAPEEQAFKRVIEDYRLTKPLDLKELTTLKPSYSLIYPSLVPRLLARITGGNYSTLIQAWVLLIITVLCLLVIINDVWKLLGRPTILLAGILICMLLGENYVGWTNSLFGEGCISTGLMMVIACSIRLIMLPKGHKTCWIWLVLLAAGTRFLCCAKAQMALALPFGLVLIVYFAWYHCPKVLLKRVLMGVMTLCLIVLCCLDTLGVYQRNAVINGKYTTWQSVFYGVLMIADDPDAAMEELGIDPAMKPDIGKHAYLSDRDYVYPIQSEEAAKGFFDNVSTFTIVGYYLRHPKDLIFMLQRAASQSTTLHDGWMTYVGEEYAGAGEIYKFNLWMNLRPMLAFNGFWQYVVMYLAVLALLARMLFRKTSDTKRRGIGLIILCIMGIGALQFPLSVIGNGFADNNKQLYCFMLCHDLLVLWLITYAMYKIKAYLSWNADNTMVEGMHV